MDSTAATLFLFWFVIVAVTGVAAAMFFVYPESRLWRIARMPVMPSVFYSLAALHLFAGLMTTGYFLLRGLL
jgi:uncharacterized protein YqhQ